MDMGLEGKTALVCGASSGLGKACAVALASERADVIICARNKPNLDKTASEISRRFDTDVYAFAADLSKSADIEKLAEAVNIKFGGVDILITNAGGPPAGNSENLTDENWMNGFDLTFMSVVRLVNAFSPRMKENKWGRIINLASISVREPIDGLILSNAIRSAVVGFAKTLSRELGPFGILVNNIITGSFDTDRLRSLHTIRADKLGVEIENLRKEVQSEIPLERFGRPEELANLVCFLAGERSSYITGTSIPVDGGALKGIF
ncbi:SDR family oxidoreductase [Candidatus Latescibacterota bacterium]